MPKEQLKFGRVYMDIEALKNNPLWHILWLGRSHKRLLETSPIFIFFFKGWCELQVPKHTPLDGKS